MLIWLTVLLLFGLFGALGYVKGAVRMIFPLVGLFVALALALPLSPLIRPLVPKVGLENPIWAILLPPVVVFFVISLAFVGVGFFGHAKVNLFYKYRADDLQRMNWQRLNQRLGVAVGLIAGCVYAVLIGVVILVLGYLTVQVSPDGAGGVIGTLNRARADLRSSGLEKLAAVFDPAPDWYYDGADVLGLLYHNQPLHTRLASYPPFISLSETPEFQEVAADTEFQTLLASQPSLAQLLENPRMQALVGNPAVLDQLRTLDFKDLEAYLRTGASEKFQDPPILGRWEVDPYLTFLAAKKQNREMTAADVRLLRFHMEFVKGFKLYATPDKVVRIKGPDVAQMIGRLEEIAKAVQTGGKPRSAVQYVAPTPTVVPTQGGSGPSSVSREMIERYGINPGARAAQQPGFPADAQVAVPVVAAPTPQVTAAQVAAEIAALPFATLADGAWAEDDGQMTLSLNPRQELRQFVVTRRSSNIKASVREERLFLVDQGQTVVMAPF